MTNENKTVAQLMEGIEADAWARYSIGNPEQVPELILNGFMSETRKLSGAWTPLFSPADIERVFGLVLAERDATIAGLEELTDRSGEHISDLAHQLGNANEHISAQAALLVQQERELMEFQDVLRRSGFVRCDIQACNCGSWHHRHGLPERMAELKDSLSEVGFPLCNENGNLISKALAQLIAEYTRLQEQSASLSSAVAELTEVGDARYLAGTAEGRAQATMCMAEHPALSGNPGKWFPIDVLGRYPMREYEPGIWETAWWPSELNVAPQSPLPENPLQALADESQQPSVNDELLAASKTALETSGMIKGRAALFGAVRRAEAAKKVRP